MAVPWCLSNYPDQALRPSAGKKGNSLCSHVLSQFVIINLLPKIVAYVLTASVAADLLILWRLMQLNGSLKQLRNHIRPNVRVEFSSQDFLVSCLHAWFGLKCFLSREVRFDKTVMVVAVRYAFFSRTVPGGTSWNLQSRFANQSKRNAIWISNNIGWFVMSSIRPGMMSFDKSLLAVQLSSVWLRNSWFSRSRAGKNLIPRLILTTRDNSDRLGNMIWNQSGLSVISPSDLPSTWMGRESKLDRKEVFSIEAPCWTSSWSENNRIG